MRVFFVLGHHEMDCERRFAFTALILVIGHGRPPIITPVVGGIVLQSTYTKIFFEKFNRKGPEESRGEEEQPYPSHLSDRRCRERGISGPGIGLRR